MSTRNTKIVFNDLTCGPDGSTGQEVVDTINQIGEVVEQHDDALPNKLETVAVDGTTITGDGTSANPLVATNSSVNLAFTDLTDSPGDYAGAQGMLVKVNATEDGLIFGDPSGSSVSWGDIQGTLSNQTDLVAELDAKQDDVGLGEANQVLTTVDDGTGTLVISWEDVPGGGGTGDMTKAVYDTNDDGVVDDSERLGGFAASEYAFKTDLHDHANKDVLDALTDAGSGAVITDAERTKLGLAVESDNTDAGQRVVNMIALTQDEYDALTPDASTLYIITP